MNLLILNILSLLLLAVSSFAETYYVDSKLGNDNNSGLLPSSAWKTIAKINNHKFENGDTVLFKKGCMWRDELIVPNGFLSFDSYGAGKKPVIMGSESLLRWKNTEENKWTIRSNSNFGWVWFIEKDETIIWGNKCDDTSKLQNQFDFYIDSSFVMIYSHSDPNYDSILVEASLRDFGIVSGWYKSAMNSISINNIEICFTKNSAVRAIGAVDWKIKNSIFHHNGGIDESDGQGIQFEGVDGEFCNNKIFENGQHGIFISSFGNAQVENNIIEANEIYNNYHTGIDLMNHGGDENSHNNTIIRRNIIYDTFDFSGKEIGIQLLGYDLGKIKNVVIHHNLIYDMKGIGISIMNNSDSIFIHNNTILNSLSACLNINNGKGFTEVYNNVGVNEDYYSVLFLHTTTNKILDFNIWYSPNPSSTSNVFVIDRYFKHIKNYNQVTGFDIHGSFWDPGIKKIGINNIELEPNSICIDKGINLNYKLDLFGNLIMNNADIGAVELSD